MRQPTWLLRMVVTAIILKSSAHLIDIHVKRTLPWGIFGYIFGVVFEVGVHISPDTWSFPIICTAHLGNSFLENCTMIHKNVSLYTEQCSQAHWQENIEIFRGFIVCYKWYVYKFVEIKHALINLWVTTTYIWRGESQ